MKTESQTAADSVILMSHPNKIQHVFFMLVSWWEECCLYAC